MSGSDLFTGTLDLLILGAVADTPRHGYAVRRWISHRDPELLNVEEGALYLALYRLAGKGFLTAEWGVTDTGRRAKVYHLTARGRKHLEAEKVRWREHVRAVRARLDLSGA